ncbi:hypothetical protein FHS07_000318 [Microbacterium proteolyticum]|uniref:Uncharacterized protein n=1 Tax=Microbacterium proteolyticum TaxID=1572644 RepID=A0A7W5CGU9_9MICO|nr:hypothetical protein [Microbacterium proteolyticum]MBB3156634.1 hypothetical protein [Microbacterium proteolyticum]
MAIVADPVPPRPGLESLADRLAELRAEISRLNRPSGTQRAGIVGNLSGMVDYIGARTTRATDPGSSWSMTVPGDGVERVYETGTALTFTSTGSALVEVVTGHARMTLLGSGSAAISLRMAVRDAATGVTIPGSSAGASARLAASVTNGVSMRFGTLAAIRPGPVEVVVLIVVSCSVQTSFDVDAPTLMVKPL